MYHDEGMSFDGPDLITKFHKMMHDIHDFELLQTRRTKILIYVFILIVYASIQITLIIANTPNQEFIEANYYGSFHLLEFWAVFVF